MLSKSLRAIICTAAMILVAPTASAATCDYWPAWTGFRTHFMNDSGRIIDPSGASGISTSEGQSYGLFFSLVANDRDSFDRILHWTEDNLAGGDLTAHLPAWKWGKRDDNNWGVIDSNSASDADLWMAYTLAEAGRLWKSPKYTALAQLLAERIVHEESAVIAGLGPTLLPGAKGFEPEPGTYRLNPSYFPLQLLRRMSTLYPQSAWPQLITSAVDIIVRSAPVGFAPDWVIYKEKGGFQPDLDNNAMGSYNAIRVYLWAGMLDDSDAVRPILLKTFKPLADYVEKNGVPPLQIDTRSGTVTDVGSAGFSAALLPLLKTAHFSQVESQQRLRVDAKSPLERSDNYYDQALTLFGLGWTDNYYHFLRNGVLAPRWTCATN